MRSEYAGITLHHVSMHLHASAGRRALLGRPLQRPQVNCGILASCPMSETAGAQCGCRAGTSGNEALECITGATLQHASCQGIRLWQEPVVRSLLHALVCCTQNARYQNRAGVCPRVRVQDVGLRDFLHTVIGLHLWLSAVAAGSDGTALRAILSSCPVTWTPASVLDIRHAAIAIMSKLATCKAVP